MERGESRAEKKRREAGYERGRVGGEVSSDAVVCSFIYVFPVFVAQRVKESEQGSHCTAADRDPCVCVCVCFSLFQEMQSPLTKEHCCFLILIIIIM